MRERVELVKYTTAGSLQVDPLHINERVVDTKEGGAEEYRYLHWVSHQCVEWLFSLPRGRLGQRPSRVSFGTPRSRGADFCILVPLQWVSSEKGARVLRGIWSQEIALLLEQTTTLYVRKHLALPL